MMPVGAPTDLSGSAASLTQGSDGLLFNSGTSANSSAIASAWASPLVSSMPLNTTPYTSTSLSAQTFTTPLASPQFSSSFAASAEEGGFVSVDDALNVPRLGIHLGQSADLGGMTADSVGQNSDRGRRTTVSALGTQMNSNLSYLSLSPSNADLAAVPASARIMLQAGDGNDEGGEIELAVDAPSSMSLADEPQLAQASDGQDSRSSIDLRPASGVAMYCDVEVAVADGGPSGATGNGAMIMNWPTSHSATSAAKATMGVPTATDATDRRGSPSSMDLSGKLPIIGSFAIFAVTGGIRLEEKTAAREKRIRTFENLRHPK
jgi:hypothetical protein